ncbi:hypothetical protein EJB05_34471, partial [Eragrostis curvula]
MAEEVAVADFSDDEEEEVTVVAEWVLVGKVLSLVPLSINTITAAMRPGWGNPYGLKFRSIGVKADNLFLAEFGCKIDRDRSLGGFPWIVGKYSVLMKEYDERLSASEISFERMEILARILNLPLGWMNEQKGTRAMSLLGTVVKMDVDANGKASGAYLRARISIEVEKPIKHGVMLRMSRNDDPRWFDAQYEMLPFFCFFCGIMGHSELECSSPVPRKEGGRPPYQTEIPLRAADDRRRKPQSFAEAAAESFGSGSSSSWNNHMHGDKRRSKPNADKSQKSASAGSGTGKDADDDATSPVKAGAPGTSKEKVHQTVARAMTYLRQRKWKGC